MRLFMRYYLYGSGYESSEPLFSLVLNISLPGNRSWLIMEENTETNANLWKGFRVHLIMNLIIRMPYNYF